MPATVSKVLLDGHVHDAILAQARRTPKKVAAVGGDRSLTYRELDRRTAALAATIGSLTGGPGALVGVHLDRSLEMLVAVIAILRAGGSYLPLDPDFPPDRLSFMVADSGLALVLSQASLAAQRPAGDYRCLEIDASAGADGGEASDAASGPGGAGSDAIYMLYTSGSMGQPKGVVLEHRNVLNFLLSMQQEPGLSPEDKLLAVTTLSFDISVLELLLPLVVGATVVIAGHDEMADGERLKSLIAEHAITVMQATPTTWRLMLEAGWQPPPGFKVLVGGEALPADLARSLAAACGEVWNMYGPTETAIWSTCYRLPPEGSPILIGAPIANTRVYVLDKAGRPVPIGVLGEIYIGGDGVARGYHNRPELNSERFLSDPFAGEEGARMYRTGDLGRYLANGQLEFRQRADNQVKVRGFRIELGEVESALTAGDGVAQAVCKVIELKPGDTRLVAYIQPEADAPLAVADLKAHLSRRLPNYMVPHIFVSVDSFPLTPNGKIDRRKLPAPDTSQALEEEYVAPETETEKAVAGVFAEVLQLERVSVEAGFFDLGGHSILATRALAMLRRDQHPGLSLRAVFEHSSARDLASAIDALRDGGEAGADKANTEELQF